MASVEQYSVEVEVRVTVIARTGGHRDVAGKFMTASSMTREVSVAAPSVVVLEAVAKAASYCRAYAAAVDNNESKRLK